MARRTGRCLCGDLAYAASADLAPVVHCHCGFCRRAHGAPFTTIGFLPASALAWRPSSAEPARFTTPAGNVRYFCARCSAPLYNTTPGVDIACVVVSSLDDDLQPAPWFHVNLESKAPWFEIRDDLPRFEAWPSPEEVRELARARGLRVPDALFGASG